MEVSLERALVRVPMAATNSEASPSCPASRMPCSVGGIRRYYSPKPQYQLLYGNIFTTRVLRAT